MRRRVLAAAVCSVALFGLSVGSALAGEVTGNGKPLWTNTDDWNVEHHTVHGASACAFSGQEDDQFPESPGFNPDAFHAQSWGQIARFAQGALGGVPGTACNPTRAEGGE